MPCADCNKGFIRICYVIARNEVGCPVSWQTIIRIKPPLSDYLSFLNGPEQIQKRLARIILMDEILS